MDFATYSRLAEQIVALSKGKRLPGHVEKRDKRGRRYWGPPDTGTAGKGGTHIEQAHGHIDRAVQVLRDGGHHEHAEALEKMKGGMKAPTVDATPPARQPETPSEPMDFKKKHGELMEAQAAVQKAGVYPNGDHVGVSNGGHGFTSLTQRKFQQHRFGAMALLIQHTPLETIRSLPEGHKVALAQFMIDRASPAQLKAIAKAHDVPNKRDAINLRRWNTEHLGITGVYNKKQTVSFADVSHHLLDHAKLPPDAQAKLQEHMNGMHEALTGGGPAKKDGDS